MSDLENRLRPALQGLGDQINQIETRVAEQRDAARASKQVLIDKLGELITQIEGLRQNGNLQNISRIRQQFNETQSQLVERTNELTETQTRLTETTEQLNNTNTNIQELRQQIQQLTAERDNLAAGNTGKDEQITQLNGQIQELTQQVEELNGQREASEQQITNLVNLIEQINGSLQRQLQNMAEANNELQSITNNDEVNELFNRITENIRLITQLINEENPQGQGPVFPQVPTGPIQNQNTGENPYDVEANFSNFLGLRGQDDFIQRVREANPNLPRDYNFGLLDNEENPDTIKRLLRLNSIIIPYNPAGGKRKRRTMKKRPRKTRKLKKRQRGGYVYSSNKELDSASSVISNSSGSKSLSSSSSKSKKMSKTRNKQKSRRRS